MTAREILIDARDRIANGWCQRVSLCFRNGRSYYCASGAIQAGRDATLGQLQIAANALRAAINDASIVAWNDTTGRTRKEVLDAFDVAIVACPTE